MNDFDLQPGAIHRGLGYVARWPGVVLVIPNDPTHDLAVEALFMELGTEPDPVDVVSAVTGLIGGGELKAAAHLTAETGGPIAMAFGKMEILVDGELVVGRTPEPTERQIAGGNRVTIRAANLSKAAEPAPPFDLRRGIVPGGGITLGGAEALAQTGLTAPPRPEHAPPPAADPATEPPVQPTRPQVPFESILLLDADDGRLPTSEPLPIAGADASPANLATSESPAGTGPDGAPAPSHRDAPTTIVPDNGDVTVHGIICSRQHFNNPSAAFCMVCGISMVHVTHNLIPGPRPTLGFVVFDDGSTFGLDRCYIVGREPGETHDVKTASLAIQDNNETLSRRHAEIRLIDWTVNIVDLGSTNGTFIWDADFERWNRIGPEQPVALSPGDTVALGRRTFVYESVTGL